MQASIRQVAAHEASKALAVHARKAHKATRAAPPSDLSAKSVCDIVEALTELVTRLFGADGPLTNSHYGLLAHEHRRHVDIDRLHEERHVVGHCQSLRAHPQDPLPV